MRMCWLGTSYYFQHVLARCCDILTSESVRHRIPGLIRRDQAAVRAKVVSCPSNGLSPGGEPGCHSLLETW
jgi:hypothetical protein